MAEKNKDEPTPALVDGSQAPGDTPEVLKVVLIRNEDRASRRTFFRSVLAGGWRGRHGGRRRGSLRRR
jgi:hypothetical protein